MEQLLPQSTVQKLWNESIRLKKFHVFHKQRSIPLVMDHGGFAVDRSRMDYVLVDHAQSLGVEFLSPAKAKLTACDSDLRGVEIIADGAAQTVLAKVVIIACGLGNHAAGPFQQFQSTPAKNSRVGVEAVFDTFPPEYRSGDLTMAIGNEGYVGLTHMGNGRLHVAAALDRATLQKHGPQEAVDHMMRQSGAAGLTQTDVTWRGTPPLTAGAASISDDRVFVIGDAAGYVEPFTGEGLRWALENGAGVAPFVISAADCWRLQIAADYRRWYRRTITARQKLCRRLSFGLKSASVRWVAHQALRLRPSLADSVIKQLNS